MTTAIARTQPHSRRRSHRHLPMSIGALVALAALAYLLLPTAHVNTSNLVQVNGVTYAVPPTVTASGLSEISALLARPGSSLDITGDVFALGQGAPAIRKIDDLPLAGDSVLTDGALVEVRHGEHRLETIRQKTQAVPFETAYEGSGPIVSLVQSGASGKRELFVGSSSGKQAAVFLLSSPQNAVLQRSKTAKPGQKMAALTFDDGPGTYTQAVLDALAAKHVPATFFVLGGAAAGNKAMIKAIKASGHEVENHTWSHPILTKVSPERVRSEISRTDAVIGGSRFLRPPYGTYNAAVAAQAHALGLRIALWTVDTLDWKYPSVESIMSYVKAQTKPGAIILMHDGGKNRSQTVAAIPVIVDWLFARGYSLTTVEQLL